MSAFLAILETALPVFAALGLGMLIRSRGFLSPEGIGAIKWAVVNVTLPFVLLSAFATAAYSKETILLPVLVFAACCLALVLGKLFVKLFRMEGRLIPFLATGFEAGMLGYALFALLYPGVSNAEFAILDLGQTLFVFTLFKILLSGKRDMRAIGRDMATSPILWAVAAGVLLGATGLYAKLGAAKGLFDGLTSFLSAPTGMMILLTIGYDLVPREIPWRRVGGFIAMRLAIMAIIAGLLLFLNRALLGGAMHEGAVLLLAILPPPYVIPVFGDEPSARSAIASALSALTLVTMVLFVVLSAIR